MYIYIYIYVYTHIHFSDYSSGQLKRDVTAKGTIVWQAQANK